MTGSDIRPATTADLDQVHDIWYRAEIENFPGPPPRGSIPPIFQHEIDTGEMYVAEAGGRILGYTAPVTRGEVAYLAELYVRGDAQSSGLGQALLSHVLSRHKRPSGSDSFSPPVICTLSSDDPRALTLYIRAGMQPRWPHFLLYADSGCLRALPLADSVEIIPARPGDPDLVRWDADVNGRPRPEDHAYWIEEAVAMPLWFMQEGQVIGYGYVQRRCHEVALWHPKALSLGPIGARSEAAALACAAAAVGWAAARAPALALGVPAAHPCLPALLSAGFRITYVETFVSTVDDALFDPACYLPSSSTLF